MEDRYGRCTLLPLFCLLLQPGALHAATSHDTLQVRAGAIDAYVARLGKLGFAGLVVLESGGQVRVERGCGLADRDRSTPWTFQTVSDLGSITKQFTAAAILRLQEHGRLRVEDPLSRHLEGVPPDKAGITLHHLLTHTSGIVDVPDKDDWDPIGRDDIVRLTMAAPLAFEPGSRYEYSNAGYSLLGVVLEKITSQTYEQFVRQTLFEPARMHETGYVLPKWDPARIAIGYRDGGRWGTTLERPFASDGPFWILRANGGIHSTAPDMLRWTRALLDDQILSAASRRALWSKHADESNGQGSSYYGYGWSIEDRSDGRTVIGHNGGNGIFFANLAIEPAERVVLFMMTNVAAEFPTQSLLEDVRRHWVTGAPLPHVPDVQRMSDANSLAGEYRTAAGPGASFVVRADGEALAVDAPTWGDFASLHGATAADLDRFETQSRSVDSCVAASLRGEYGPLHAAYGGRVPLEELRQRGEARWREEAERWGKLRSHRTLGTLPADAGSMTFVRFEHERGTHHRRYVWSANGTLRGVSQGRRGAPPRFYCVGGERFESFEAGVPSAPVGLVRDATGSWSLEFGPGGAGRARKK